MHDTTDNVETWVNPQFNRTTKTGVAGLPPPYRERYAERFTNRAPDACFTDLGFAVSMTGATDSAGFGSAGFRLRSMPGSNDAGVAGFTLACVPLLNNVTTPDHCDTAMSMFDSPVAGMIGANIRPTAPGNSHAPINTNWTNVGRGFMDAHVVINRFWNSITRHPVVRPTFLLNTPRANVSRTNAINATTLDAFTWAMANATIAANVVNPPIMFSGLPLSRVRIAFAVVVFAVCRFAIVHRPVFVVVGIDNEQSNDTSNDDDCNKKVGSPRKKVSGPEFEVCAIDHAKDLARAQNA